jgi:hypothetical protein
MKKIVIILLAFVVTACSALPVDLSFLTPATAAPTYTLQPTVTRFPSPTSTRDPFTINTQAPTEIPSTLDPAVTLPPPTRTAPPTETFRPTITLEPVDPSLFTPSPNIFTYVQTSTTQLVWGSTCDGDRSITFVANVTPVRRLKYVLLFIRLQDKYSARNTGWGAGAIMKDNDQGKYFYKLELNQIEDYRFYEDAWLQYQLVASTVGLNVLGRSVVDRTSVSVTHCSALYQ